MDSHTGLPSVVYTSAVLRTAHSQAVLPMPGAGNGLILAQGTNTEDACLPKMVAYELPHIPNMDCQVPKRSNTEASRQPSNCKSRITSCRKPHVVPLPSEDSAHLWGSLCPHHQKATSILLHLVFSCLSH